MGLNKNRSQLYTCLIDPKWKFLKLPVLPYKSNSPPQTWEKSKNQVLGSHFPPSLLETFMNKITHTTWFCKWESYRNVHNEPPRKANDAGLNHLPWLFFLVAKKKWTNSKTRQVRILVFDATVLGFSTEWVCLDQIPPAKTCDRGNGGYHAVGGKGLDLVICCLVGPDEIRVRIHEFVVACLFKRNMVQTAPI